MSFERVSTSSEKIYNNQHGYHGRFVNSRKSICCEAVTVSFGAIDAIKAISLEINLGEIVFITGASGAGKSTLLNVISDNCKTTSGKVTLPLKGTNGKKIYFSKVDQDLKLMSKYNCYENLLLSYDSLIYETEKEFENDLHELCKIFGISDRLHLKVRDCNGGLKQKIGIIRSLLTKPDVFIADEPTSSLDLENSKKLFEVLNVYNVKKGMTVIWASHNRDLVKQFSGRILHLENGRLIYSGHICFI